MAILSSNRLFSLLLVRQGFHSFLHGWCGGNLCGELLLITATSDAATTAAVAATTAAAT